MDVAVALMFFHRLEETEAIMSKALEKQLTPQQLERVRADCFGHVVSGAGQSSVGAGTV